MALCAFWDVTAVVGLADGVGAATEALEFCWAVFTGRPLAPDLMVVVAPGTVGLITIEVEIFCVEVFTGVCVGVGLGTIAAVGVL